MLSFVVMDTSDLKSKLQKTLNYFTEDIAQVRTGRVTPSLLDNIKVSAYGSSMTIKELGSISVLDAQTLQIAPWDKSVLEPLEKAIRESDLQVNPTVRDDVIIIPVPPLTEERRIEMTKIISQKLESCRQTIRNVRQDANKDVDTAFANKEFGEDEKFRLKEEVDKLVKEYVGKAEEISEKKKQDILSI